MDLNTYLKTTTQTDLADKLGVTQGLISQWVSGETNITPDKAIAIEGATDGLVTREELLPAFFRARVATV
jgi:DNA-binding transcriptional regulator YdaS (Cro superfamily)